MKTITMLLALTLTLPALAGRSGYIKDGKEYVVFKDGQKVGEWPKADEKKGRTPDSVQRVGPNSILMWEEDALARCYFMIWNPGPSSSPTPPVSCVKLL